jgi:hypothetical protein
MEEISDDFTDAWQRQATPGSAAGVAVQVMHVTADAPTLPHLCLWTASLALQCALEALSQRAKNKRDGTAREPKCCMEAREATMKLWTDQDPLILEALAAVIARSPIVVERAASSLPAGYEEVDLAVLNWIAAEGRRIGRNFVRM